ncbi:oxidoreductase [Sphingobium sp. TCM1]|uniref:oxidoreductase n=1 Tax=Sphingobium sp. TCM1 TaxID=453246 RepID=UPI0007F3514D|nr:oxidoreductase [Sphingobium sp. TCM1]OAN56239.1 hypothetical protein A7Q26_02185 [Sphingobium sp. TCM1]
MGWTVSDMPRLDGKVALVTGSTDGLGREIAARMAEKGARVILSGRREDRGAAAAQAMGATFERLDLADLAQVRDFAGRVVQGEPKIDLLINNAGVALIPELGRSADGFEMQMATNFLGHFVLTHALLPALNASGGARVVNVSSIAAGHVQMDFDNLVSENGYAPGKVYGRSKLAMLLFARELDRRAKVKGWPVTAFAAHPGVAESNLQKAGPGIGREGMRRSVVTVIGDFVTRRIGQSTAAGALPMLRAATDPMTKGGSYFGPDGWGGIRGAPVVVEGPRAGRDTAAAARLWTMAEKLTGARWD